MSACPRVLLRRRRDGQPLADQLRHGKRWGAGVMASRDFVTRDPWPSSQQCRCRPRWQAIESGTSRGAAAGYEPERDFPACGDRRTAGHHARADPSRRTYPPPRFALQRVRRSLGGGGKVRLYFLLVFSSHATSGSPCFPSVRIAFAMRSVLVWSGSSES